MRMPAEWEPHEATWLCWPHNPETWPGCFEEAQAEFVAFAALLAEHEPVRLLVPSARHEREVRARLPASIELHVVASDDSWLRDTGPTFVHGDRELLALDWRFDAWGGKYPPWEHDDAVARRIAELAGTPRIRESLVLEGGALEVDGQGSLLATRASVLGRNPGVPAGELERRLGRRLGVEKILWLDGELAGDDTDTHVDNLARFVGPGMVVYSSEPRATHASLAAALDARGRKLDTIELPTPAAVEANGQPLPASHLNFYIANGLVAVPAFGGASDEGARGRLLELFPKRRVQSLPSRALLRGLGSLHCLCQQQPSPAT